MPVHLPFKIPCNIGNWIYEYKILYQAEAPPNDARPEARNENRASSDLSLYLDRLSESIRQNFSTG